MSGLAYFQFNCQICGSHISEHDSDIQVENREEEDNLLFGKIITIHAGHQSNDTIHWNIITLDKNGEYRGHKHSYEEIVEKEKELNFSLLFKYMKKNSVKIISDIISGKSIILVDEDPILSNIILYTISFFKISDDPVFENQIRITELNKSDKLNSYFIIEKSKYYSSKNLEFEWVKQLVKKLGDLDEMALQHVCKSYVESLKNAYQKIIKNLQPFFSIGDACPIQDPSQTVQVKLFIDNMIPDKQLKDFKSQCSQNEYDVIMSIISKQFMLSY